MYLYFVSTQQFSELIKKNFFKFSLFNWTCLLHLPSLFLNSTHSKIILLFRLKNWTYFLVVGYSDYGHAWCGHQWAHLWWMLHDSSWLQCSRVFPRLNILTKPIMSRRRFLMTSSYDVINNLYHDNIGFVQICMIFYDGLI